MHPGHQPFIAVHYPLEELEMTIGQISKMMGASVKRKEDPRLITGQGKYTDDVKLVGMLHLYVLRSAPSPRQDQ